MKAAEKTASLSVNDENTRPVVSVVKSEKASDEMKEEDGCATAGIGGVNEAAKEDAMEQEDGEVSDESVSNALDDDGEIVDDEEHKERSGRRNSQQVVKVEEDSEVAKKSALEKLKNMKFSTKSKFSVGSPSRERRDREKKERLNAASDEEEAKRPKYPFYGGSALGRGSSPRRENDDDRRTRKRRWEEHNDDERHFLRGNERPRPLRETLSPAPNRPAEPPRPVDQPGTLRQRVERLICITEAEVAALSDIDLRSLLVKIFEVDREQKRLYNGRQAQIETLREMHKQAKEDVERLINAIPAHLRPDLPPLPAPLNIPRTESASLNGIPPQVNGGVCSQVNQHPSVPNTFAPPPGLAGSLSLMSAPTAAAVVSGSSGPANSASSASQLGFSVPPSSQGSQEFGPPTSQPSASGSTTTFPVAPSLLNRAPGPAYGMGGPAVPSGLPPAFLNVPPPPSAPGSGMSSRFGVPLSSLNFTRPPPNESQPSAPPMPNLNQPPPARLPVSSANIPPPNFSLPPPSSTAPASAPSVSASTTTTSASNVNAPSSFSTTLSTNSNVDSPLVNSRASPAPSTSILPPVNLSVPPPMFNVPPPRTGGDSSAQFTGPPPSASNSPMAHTARNQIPSGPGALPSLLSGPPPSIPINRPPPVNISGPANLSCPPPSMSCPPPNIRSSLNLGTPQNVHQMVPTIVNQSSASGQTSSDAVTDLINTAYSRPGGVGSMSSSSAPISRMSLPPPGIGPPISGPPPNLSTSNKLPTVNLSSSSSRSSSGGGSYRNFNNQTATSNRYGSRSQQQSQQQRRQISDIVAIIPDEHDISEARESQEDSNIFLIVSDEEDSGK